MKKIRYTSLLSALLALLIMASLIPFASCGGPTGADKNTEPGASQAASSAEEAQAQLAQDRQPAPPSPQEEAISALQDAGATASALAADPARAATDTEALKASVAASTAELADTINRTGDKLSELGLEGKQERFEQESSKMLAAIDRVKAASDGINPEDPASYNALSQVIDDVFASPEPAVLSADLSHRSEPDTPSPPTYGTSIAPAYLAGAPGLTPSSLPVEPGDEDLAETPDAPQSEEITALAEQLGNDPVAIYEWVRNNIDFESYYGSRKGAVGCLKEMAGNSTDNASLLVALFRASGIPARYVTGVIELTMDQACSWLAVDTVADAQSLLASGCIPVTGIVEGGTVSRLRLTQTWTEAYVNYSNYRGASAGEGPSCWIPLDASYKTYTISYPQIDVVTDMGLSYESLSTEYLSTVREETFLSFIEAKVKTLLSANMPQLTLADVMRAKAIKQESLGILPSDLLYKTVSAEAEERELPASSRWAATLNLADTTLTCDFVSLSSGTLEVSFTPATEEDEALLSAYESIQDVPAYLLDMTGEIAAGEQTVQTQSHPFGSSSSWGMTISSPGRSYRIDNTLTWGAPFSVALAPAPGPVNGEIALEMGPNFPGCLFDQAASSYISSITGDDSDLARLFGLSLTKGAQEASVGISLAPRTASGVVVSATPDGIYIDADLSTATPAGKTKADRRDFTLASGFSSSAHEHKCLQDSFSSEAVSTAKLLALANQNAIPIVDITRSNASAIETLSLPAYVKQQMRDQANAGYTVTTPAQQITYKEFTGEGWMVTDPATGEGAYLISGGLAGGRTIVGDTSLEALIYSFLGDDLEWMYLEEMTTYVTRGAGGYYPPEEYPDILSNAEYHANLVEGDDGPPVVTEDEEARKVGIFVMGDGIWIRKLYRLKYKGEDRYGALEVMDFLDTSIRPAFDNSGQYRYLVGLDGIDSEANPYLNNNNPILYFKLMPFIKDGRDFGYENSEDTLAAIIVDMWDQDVGHWYGTDVLERPLDLLASWRYERPASSRTESLEGKKENRNGRTFHTFEVDDQATDSPRVVSMGIFGNPDLEIEEEPICLGWQYVCGKSGQFNDISSYKYKYLYALSWESLTFVPHNGYDKKEWDTGLCSLSEPTDLLLKVYVGDSYQDLPQTRTAYIREREAFPSAGEPNIGEWEEFPLVKEDGIVNGIAYYRDDVNPVDFIEITEEDDIPEVAAADFTGIEDSMHFLEGMRNHGYIFRGLAEGEPNSNEFIPGCSEVGENPPPFFRAGGGVEVLEASTEGERNKCCVLISNPSDCLFVTGHHGRGGKHIYNGDCKIKLSDLVNNLRQSYLSLLVLASCNSLWINEQAITTWKETGVLPREGELTAEETVEKWEGVQFSHSNAEIMLGYCSGSPGEGIDDAVVRWYLLSLEGKNDIQKSDIMAAWLWANAHLDNWIGLDLNESPGDPDIFNSEHACVIDNEGFIPIFYRLRKIGENSWEYVEVNVMELMLFVME